ncbi:MAG TPA: wax ester/triacylglycerol synthase family O-acyltransferase [Candidatus Sulfomarinibacteraceae bacterium]|nr:wax ester/triacylglycerol synthase family O-acyltransferase [Candidatus Sulfomarinibacteraceae bacterium]
MALLPGEAMSNVDAAWLHMEDRTNLMVITGVLSFYEKLDFAKLKELIEDRLLGYDRFRQRVVEPAVPLAGPRWVEDRYFNLRSHLQRVALPDPGGQEELQEMVSILMSTPLDMNKPLWQFQYIENYRGGSALVARVHHCIGDGIALVRVLLGMTDDSPQGSPAARRSRRRRKPLGGGFWLPEVVNEALWSVRRATGKVVDGTVETLLDPVRAAGMAGQGIKAGGVLGRLALMPADPVTVLKGELGTAKRCAWSKILPLDDVKVFSKSVGATINDVLLSGVTGALRRYLLKRGEAVADGLDLRAIVPVNLRPEHEVDRLGNRFGLVFLALPVGLEDRAERLTELKRRMDGIKRSTEAVVTYGVLNALGTASASVESQAVRFFGSKATAVMTNVPGPRQELYLAGKAMRSMMFWVPQAAHLGLGVSILSYAGQVRLGIATDVGLAPDPQSIIEAFQDEMTAMLGGGA